MCFVFLLLFFWMGSVMVLFLWLRSKLFGMGICFEFGLN